MSKEEIDQKYLGQASQLETEFFDVVNEGLPSQHRVLKDGKSIDEFNQRHGEIWLNHEAELIAEGFMEAPLPPEPTRNLAMEIEEIKAKIADYGDLKARIESLESR